MHLIVGLGNPGLRYAPTRHNIGFMAVDFLVEKRRGQWRGEEEHHSQVAVLEIADQEVMLAKPQTYMNQSGAAVHALSERYAVKSDDILIVLDDFLLKFGRMRFRRGGSDGGHKGLASVLEEMGTREIPRLRLGIGPLPEETDPIDFVLSPFGPEEAVEDLVKSSGRAIEVFLKEGIEAAMNQFNGMEVK